jgi:hypothetical protein
VTEAVEQLDGMTSPGAPVPEPVHGAPAGKILRIRASDAPAWAEEIVKRYGRAILTPPTMLKS